MAYIKDPSKRGRSHRSGKKRPERPPTHPDDRQGPRKRNVVPIIVTIFVIIMLLLGGIFYMYMSVNREVQKERERAERMRLEHLHKQAVEEAKARAEAGR